MEHPKEQFEAVTEHHMEKMELPLPTRSSSNLVPHDPPVGIDGQKPLEFR